MPRHATCLPCPRGMDAARLVVGCRTRSCPDQVPIKTRSSPAPTRGRFAAVRGAAPIQRWAGRVRGGLHGALRAPVGSR